MDLAAIHQPETGYRFSQDPFILVDHALPYLKTQIDLRYQDPKLQNPKSQNPKSQNPKSQNPKSQNPKSQNPNLTAAPLTILDIGTGSGIIPLLLISQLPKDAAWVTAIEIQKPLFDTAKRNVRRYGMTHQISLIHGDVLEWVHHREKSVLPHGKKRFDVVISNPPYIKQGCGRINPSSEKAMARHEISLTLEGLIQTASSLLKPGGALFLIYPTLRKEELLHALARHGLTPNRIRPVQPPPHPVPPVDVASLEASQHHLDLIQNEPKLMVLTAVKKNGVTMKRTMP